MNLKDRTERIIELADTLNILNERVKHIVFEYFGYEKVLFKLSAPGAQKSTKNNNVLRLETLNSNKH